MTEANESGGVFKRILGLLIPTRRLKNRRQAVQERATPHAKHSKIDT